jgi:hypothetical protein
LDGGIWKQAKCTIIAIAVHRFFRSKVDFSKLPDWYMLEERDPRKNNWEPIKNRFAPNFWEGATIVMSGDFNKPMQLVQGKSDS